jgi:hypothetical protein
MLGPILFQVAVETLANEAVATSAIEGISVDRKDAYAAAWMQIQNREVAELQAQAQEMNPTLTPEQAHQVALKTWMKLMLEAPHVRP